MQTATAGVLVTGAAATAAAAKNKQQVAQVGGAN